MRVSERIPYKDVIIAEIKEIKSKQNTKEARRIFGHRPTLLERVSTFVRTGRDQLVLAAFSEENIFFTGTEIGTDPTTLPRRQRIRALLSHCKRFYRMNRHPLNST